MSQPPFRYSNIESNKLLPGIKLVEDPVDAKVF